MLDIKDYEKAVDEHTIDTKDYYYFVGLIRPLVERINLQEQQLKEKTEALAKQETAPYPCVNSETISICRIMLHESEVTDVVKRMGEAYEIQHIAVVKTGTPRTVEVDITLRKVRKDDDKKSDEDDDWFAVPEIRQKETI